MIIQGNLQNGSFCLSINRLVMPANDFTAENDLESFQKQANTVLSDRDALLVEGSYDNSVDSRP